MNDAPSTIEPATGRSLSTRTAVDEQPDDAGPSPPTTTRAAASGAWRPTGMARTSSSRPLSSSAAGEPDDEQQAHEADEGEAERADLERDLAADRVEGDVGPLKASAAGLSCAAAAASSS